MSTTPGRAEGAVSTTVGTECMLGGQGRRHQTSWGQPSVLHGALLAMKGIYCTKILLKYHSVKLSGSASHLIAWTHVKHAASYVIIEHLCMDCIAAS